jgi:transmembrane 9 superfamily protein 2/4
VRIAGLRTGKGYGAGDGHAVLVLASTILAMALLPYRTAAIYLPGVAPREYQEGGKVDLKVNKLTSVKTQLPYGYYTLPHCKPSEIKHKPENLGEILVGDLIENSPYEILMQQNESCKFLCKLPLQEKEKNVLRTYIDDEYLVNWIVDGLPAATRYIRKADGSEFMYMNGFPIGIQKDGMYYVHNHVTLNLKYHARPEQYEGYRIVGFEVEPHSLKQATRADASAPGGIQPLCEEGVATPLFNLDDNQEIIYTYDVRWSWSSTRWASRWDNYLQMTGGQVHWFSIMNSLLIVLFLSGMLP